MAVVLDDEGTILGWYLVDLDDDGPKRLYHLAEKLGINVERLIDEAMSELLTTAFQRSTGLPD